MRPGRARRRLPAARAAHRGAPRLTPARATANDAALAALLAVLVGVLTSKFAPPPPPPPAAATKEDGPCCGCSTPAAAAAAPAPEAAAPAPEPAPEPAPAPSGLLGLPLQVTEVTETFEESLVSSVQLDVLGGAGGGAVAKSNVVLPSDGLPGVHTVLGDIAGADAPEAEAGVVSFELLMPAVDVIKTGAVSLDVRPVLHSNGWPANSWPQPAVKAHCELDAAKMGTIDVSADVCREWSIEATQTVPASATAGGEQSITLSADSESGPKIRYEKTLENDHKIGASISSPAADLALSYAGAFAGLEVSGEIDAPSRVGSLEVSASLPGDAGDLSLKLSNDGAKPVNVSAHWCVKF